MTWPREDCFFSGTFPPHGGDLGWAESMFPQAPRPWIDLSTGVNPWSYLVSSVRWDRLPSAVALDALLEAAGRYYRIAPGLAIVAVPGVELAIRLLPHLLDKARHVAIAGPTYSSYADAWRNAGCEVRVIEDFPIDTTDVCIVVSPNNPDGRVLTRDALEALAEQMHRKGGVLIADRSFADVSGEPDALRPVAGLIELRSFGKFFGLPGLRLGFAIGDVEPLREALGAWPVNAAALETGRIALGDADWQNETRDSLKIASADLDAILRRYGTIVGGTDLFRLVRVADATRLFRHLALRGILTRVFDYEPSWIRFGLPANATALARLAKALDDFAESE